MDKLKELKAESSTQKENLSKTLEAKKTEVADLDEQLQIAAQKAPRRRQQRKRKKKQKNSSNRWRQINRLGIASPEEHPVEIQAAETVSQKKNQVGRPGTSGGGKQQQ